MTHLTRSVAAEVGANGIRVNSISPGGVATGIFGKNAGVEGSKADKVLDVVKEVFATVQPIPRSGTDGRYCQCCCLPCERPCLFCPRA